MAGESDDAGRYSLKFYYNNNGLLDSIDNQLYEGVCLTTLYYNKDGELEKAKERNAYINDIYTTTYNYKILEYDQFKNWTKRIVDYKTEFEELTDSTEVTTDNNEPETLYRLEERDIIYK